MRDEGQMFLMGAVLLSAIFFATAAFQTSSPYVVQSANQFESVQDWNETAEEFWNLSRSTCISIGADCVETLFAYWEKHTLATVELDCSLGSFELTFTERHRTMVYQREALALCPIL